MEDYKREFIQFMKESQVLTFGDFVTKSGRKTPYFINTGRYQTGKQIQRLGEFYAACIVENMRTGVVKEEVSALFGPAYKGIPLAVATSIALSERYGRDVGYCFNRKERKDHGEGGTLVGYSLEKEDHVLMIEDVITAGTAVRETLPVLVENGNPSVGGLVISVDRMERGLGEKTAIQELREEFGISTISIVTVEDLLPEVPLDFRPAMEAYMTAYCVKG